MFTIEIEDGREAPLKPSFLYLLQPKKSFYPPNLAVETPKKFLTWGKETIFWKGGKWFV